MAGLTGSSVLVALQPNRTATIVNANEDRRLLTVYNGLAAPLSIGIHYDETGKLDTYFATIAPRTIYQLPTTPDGSIYTGAIYAIAALAGKVHCTEFINFVVQEESSTPESLNSKQPRIYAVAYKYETRNFNCFICWANSLCCRHDSLVCE